MRSQTSLARVYKPDDNQKRSEHYTGSGRGVCARVCFDITDRDRRLLSDTL